MALFEMTSDRLTPIGSTTFAAAGVRERDDLQRLLRAQIELLVPNGMVLAEEFASWEDSRRSIDLLVLDKDANLVVVELKRTEDGGHMELQALRYAAMVSPMTFDQAVEAHRRFLLKLGETKEPEQCILEFLGWSAPNHDQFAQDVRIVLASADFKNELMTTVLWLNQSGLDIICVRLICYTLESRVLVDVQQVVPLPDASDFQIRIRQKAIEERASRKFGGDPDRANRFARFWKELLEKSKASLPLFSKCLPANGDTLSVRADGFRYAWAIGRDGPRVEVTLDSSDRSVNEKANNYLRSRESEIKKDFQGELQWRQTEAGRVRIMSLVEGSFDDETKWDQLHFDSATLRL